MKRKSEQIHPNIIRHLKKNKTQGYQNVKHKLIDQNSHRWSQIIVQKILEQITQTVHNKVSNIAHDQFLNAVIQSCSFMAQNLSQLICPELHEKQNYSVIIDKQPQRVAYDPICGFDKLFTLKNDTTKTRQNSLLQSKVKAFGVFQNGKKQNQNQKNNSIASASKLVPLQSVNLSLLPTKSQKQNEKQQSFLRDRIFDNGLPMLNVPQHQRSQQKLSKMGIDLMKQTQAQDCIFDYNGQKTTLVAFSKLNSTSLNKIQTNHVLRTTYRVLDCSSIQDKKKYSLTKNRASQLSTTFQKRVSKEIIKNPNLKSQGNNDFADSSLLRSGYVSDHGQVVKNLLEASFRQKQIIFRSIEKSHRLSKIL